MNEIKSLLQVVKINQLQRYPVSNLIINALHTDYLLNNVKAFTTVCNDLYHLL